MLGEVAGRGWLGAVDWRAFGLIWAYTPALGIGWPWVALGGLVAVCGALGRLVACRHVYWCA